MEEDRYYMLVKTKEGEKLSLIVQEAYSNTYRTFTKKAAEEIIPEMLKIFPFVELKKI